MGLEDGVINHYCRSWFISIIDCGIRTSEDVSLGGSINW
jgi:hypothetical protein